MKLFDVSTDSTCDLYAPEIKENGLFFLPLTYSLEDANGKVTEYADNFEKAEQYKEYYDRLRAGLTSRTSMNNPFIHEEYFTAMAKSGVKDAIHFTISYGLCRTVEVAREAVAKVKESYPDFNCLCVECNTTTVGQGLLVKIAVDMRNKGKTLQETFDYVEKVKFNIQHFIIVDDLNYLLKGGRISATSAVVGGMLKVKPILVFNKEGKLQKYKQSTGMKHTVTAAVKEFEKYTVNKDYPTVYVAHSDNEEMAKFMESQLKLNAKVQTEIRMVGPVIGTHLGPGTVAYAFLSNEERPL